MRIRIILAAAAAPAALAAILLGTTGTAFASTTPHAPASSTSIVQQANNGAKTSNAVIAKATFSYPDAFGQMNYTETEHPQSDSVTGTFAGGQTAASLGMQPGRTSQIGWVSDFNSSLPQGTLTYTINAAGTGFTGTATYPAA
jgi:Flp pilus assembly protein CpaB